MQSFLVLFLGPRRNNSKRHEMRMRTLPRECLLTILKEAIDHDGIALHGGVTSQSGRFAIDHGRTAVNRDTSGVREYYFAAIGNSLRIDRAMSIAQTRAIPRGAELTFASPVNRHTREDGLFARKSGRDSEDAEGNSGNQSLHFLFSCNPGCEIWSRNEVRRRTLRQ